MFDRASWWVFQFIKQWSSDHGMDLSGLISELDKHLEQDLAEANVTQFWAKDILNLTPRDDGTFSVVLKGGEHGFDDPLICHTLILQEGEPCLAVS